MNKKAVAIIIIGGPWTTGPVLSGSTNKSVLPLVWETTLNDVPLIKNYKYSESGNNSDSISNSFIEKIAEFRTLQQDWDGYGAIPLLEKVYRNAASLINSVGDPAIQNVDDFFPNPNGTLSIVWKNAKSERVSVEIDNSTFSYYYKSNAGNPQFFNSNRFESDDISSLRGVIEQII